MLTILFDGLAFGMQLIILERGAVVYAGASPEAAQDHAALERFLGVSRG